MLVIKYQKRVKGKIIIDTKVHLKNQPLTKEIYKPINSLKYIKDREVSSLQYKNKFTLNKFQYQEYINLKNIYNIYKHNNIA